MTIAYKIDHYTTVGYGEFLPLPKYTHSTYINTDDPQKVHDWCTSVRDEKWHVMTKSSNPEFDYTSDYGALTIQAIQIIKL